MSHFIALPCGKAVELEVSQRSLVLCNLPGTKLVLQATLQPHGYLDLAWTFQNRVHQR